MTQGTERVITAFGFGLLVRQIPPLRAAQHCCYRATVQKKAAVRAVAVFDSGNFFLTVAGRNTTREL